MCSAKNVINTYWLWTFCIFLISGGQWEKKNVVQVHNFDIFCYIIFFLFFPTFPLRAIKHKRLSSNAIYFPLDHSLPYGAQRIWSWIISKISLNKFVLLGPWELNISNTCFVVWFVILLPHIFYPGLQQAGCQKRVDFPKPADKFLNINQGDFSSMHISSYFLVIILSN